MRAAAVALALVALAGVGCGGSARHEGARAAPAASLVAEKRVGPRLIDLTVRSPALGTTAMVRLLTPVGWRRGDKARRWPVLYLLHGCCDTDESWTRSTRIASWRRLRGVLVVMPEGGDVGFYSDWRGTGGKPGPGWETFHVDELRRLLERDYGAGSRRAIAGESMGGLGAMAYAARHPGLFRAAAAFSGLVHPQADARFLLGLFASYTPDPRAIWGDPVRDRSTWARHDPTALAPRLRGVRLFVSSGDGRPGRLEPAARRDATIEPAVLRESRAFVARLRAQRIPVRADFYGAGSHDWPYWERELRRALPTLFGA